MTKATTRDPRTIILELAEAVLAEDWPKLALSVGWITKVEATALAEMASDRCSQPTTHTSTPGDVPLAVEYPPEGWVLVPVEPTREMVEAGSMDLGGGPSTSDEDTRWMIENGLDDAEGVYRAMLSAAPRADPPWRPIETAPRDGTEFIFRLTGEDGWRRHYVASWRSDKAFKKDGGYYDYRSGVWDLEYPSQLYSATWLPLPAPPAGDAG